MKTARFQTARVYWRMGQPLLPSHFYAQESALREELFVQHRLAPHPWWGVASLSWDDFQLSKGAVVVQDMVVVMPGGALVDVPGNSAAPSFNLNTTGATRTPLFLHLMAEASVASVATGAGQEPVERVVQKLQLAAQPYLDGAVQSFKLAEFEKGAEGSWALAQDFLPSLLRVTGSPFFEPYLQRIRGVCTALGQVLLEEIQENYLAGESLVAARACLRGLYGLRAQLANVGREFHPHPAELFEALHGLYLDVCVLRGMEPSPVERIYAHDELGPGFRELLGQLEAPLQGGRSSTPYVPFERREGLQVCRVPEAARKARHVYLLLQKPRTAGSLEVAGLKLASESRVPVVHQLALRGVPYRRIERPPFHHPFSSEVEFFALSEGEEWDHVVREGRLGFFHRPDLDAVRAFLYWRTE